MKQSLTTLVLLGACLALQPQAWAETGKAKPKAVTSAKKAVNEAPAKQADDEEAQALAAKSATVEYQCALGARVTLYENASDPEHIALHWEKRLHRMDRVTTTTGARRYENAKFGLVWIGIPAKGILLDSRKGQQLANDCKNAEQRVAQQPAPQGGGLLATGSQR